MRKCILVLYAKSKKRFGAEKMKICLKRDYRINISAGRAYRLMKSMNLPKMSAVKPFKHKSNRIPMENAKIFYLRNSIRLLQTRRGYATLPT